MRRVIDLSRDVLGVLRDHKHDLCGVTVIPSETAGRYDVCATLVDGRVIVLARGVTRAASTDLAEESKLAVLAIRTGAEYPPSDMPLPRHGTGGPGDGGLAAESTRDFCGRAAGSIQETFRRMAVDIAHVPFKPNAEAFGFIMRADHAAAVKTRKATVPDFRGVPLMTVCRERLVTRENWLSIGARYAEQPVLVHWRSVSHSRQSVHWTFDRRRTVCNIPIPDGRSTRVVYNTRAGGAGDCQRCADAVARQTVGVGNARA